MNRVLLRHSMWPLCLLFGSLLLVSMATCELVHVSVLFRHGHRSPMRLLPNQNFTVQNTWRDGLGQLTNIGKRNELELGQFLRKRYDAFLGGRYNSSAHYVRSTDVDRTLMSAQACLAGLFPPTGSQNWTSQLAWQPIPVHTLPQAQDHLLASPEYPCPRRDAQFAATRSDPERNRLYTPFQDLLSSLTAWAGYSVTPDNVYSVVDTLWINRVAGLPTPAWLNASANWSRLVQVGSLQWREYSWTPELVRFGSGRLVDEILGVMTNLSEGRPPARGARLRVYSDHDTTVSSMLAALGNRDFVWPNFASCVMLELHSSDSTAGGSGVFSLRVWFRNDTGREPYRIPLPGACPDPCPLPQALKSLASMRLSKQSLRKRCYSSGGGGGIWDRLAGRTTLLVVSGTLLLICCVFALLTVARCVRGRRHRSAVVYRSLNDVEG